MNRILSVLLLCFVSLAVGARTYSVDEIPNVPTWCFISTGKHRTKHYSVTTCCKCFYKDRKSVV